MKMRPVLATLLFFTLAGCKPDPSVSLKRNDLVGEYAYKSVDTSVDKASDHQLDHLILQADGEFILVEGGSTKLRSETRGTWGFTGGSEPSLSLNHAGYPVEMKGQEIRFLINNDLGESGTRRRSNRR